jgi:hypothetical protein
MASTRTKQLLEESNGGPTTKTFFSDLIAIGVVVDTNDPMQWGRVRAVVTVWGDNWHHNVEDMPWITYVSPFGGHTSGGTRGSDLDGAGGTVGYGMWAIPKVGAQIVVMSLDEDHQQRLYIGCVFDPFVTSTLPHGNGGIDHPETGTPYSHQTLEGNPIQPIHKNVQTAFNNQYDSSQYLTRGYGGYTATAVSVEHLDQAGIKIPDDKSYVKAGWSNTQGYQLNRIDPAKKTTLTDRNYDSQVYSITSPGFHAVAMDDRMENCRLHLRTTSGHQLLMDDTNQRIYLSTAQGNNWVEMDQAGNIDIFTTNKVSIHAAKDINLTSDASIRMFAKEGIHMYSKKEIRMHADDDINIHTQKNIKTEATKNINIKSGADFKLTTGGSTNINATGNVLITAPEIYQNGPAAALASTAVLAFYTNRVPAHEPWTRGMTKNDNSHVPDLLPNDPDSGKSERGMKIPRGVYWRA